MILYFDWILHCVQNDGGGECQYDTGCGLNLTVGEGDYRIEQELFCLVSHKTQPPVLKSGGCVWSG